MNKMSVYTYFCFLGWILVFGSCSESPEDIRNIRSYFYPLQELEAGLAYEYRPVKNDSLASEYWYYRTFDRDSGYFFTGQFYDYDFTVRQLVNEEVVSNGTLVSDYYLYYYDTLEKLISVPVDIEVANSFPFEVKDSSALFLTKMKWKDPVQEDFTTTLIRNKRYRGDTTYVIDDIVHDCIWFSVKELVETEQEGFQEFQYNGVEFYAKDIGLVYYKKQVTPELILEYELAGRYSMDQLIQEFDTKK